MSPLRLKCRVLFLFLRFLRSENGPQQQNQGDVADLNLRFIFFYAKLFRQRPNFSKQIDEDLEIVGHDKII